MQSSFSTDMNRSRIQSNIAFLCLFLGVLLQPHVVNGEALVAPVEHFPPWLITDQDPIRGINVQILEELAARLNLQLVFVKCPWKRCLKMMKLGEGDIMTSLLKRPQRETYMHYIEPPYKTKSTKAFYVIKGKKQSIQKYEDLFKLQIGAQLGTKYFEPFDSDQTIAKNYVTNDIQNLKKLERGRLDAVIGTESNIDYLIISEGFAGKFDKAQYRYDHKIDVYMAISRRSPYARQINRFNRTMQQLVEEGVIDEIVESFFSQANK